MTFISKSRGALHLALLKVLRCGVCPTCGSEKEEKKPLCKTCYWALQPPLRKLLFTDIDEAAGEFEDYYLTAMRDLKRRNLMRPIKHWKPEAQRIISETGLIAALAAISQEEKASH